jgi:hypothetical protein
MLCARARGVFAAVQHHSRGDRHAVLGVSAPLL